MYHYRLRKRRHYLIEYGSSGWRAAHSHSVTNTRHNTHAQSRTNPCAKPKSNTKPNTDRHSNARPDATGLSRG